MRAAHLQLQMTSNPEKIPNVWTPMNPLDRLAKKETVVVRLVISIALPA